MWFPAYSAGQAAAGRIKAKTDLAQLSLAENYNNISYVYIYVFHVVYLCIPFIYPCILFAYPRRLFVYPCIPFCEPMYSL